MTLALLCAAFPASAIELLSDPTRPAAGAYPATGEAGAATAPQPVIKDGLQSVIISPQRRAAVVNGATVELGEKVGDATLVEVRESSVVLQNAQGKRVLELFPGVRMNKSEPVLPQAEKPVAIKSKKEAKRKNIKASEPMSSEQNKDERVGK